MRPTRLYHHTFRHAAVERPVMLPAYGKTPCEAKNMAWGMLTKLVKIDALPENGWEMTTQEDQGVLLG